MSNPDRSVDVSVLARALQEMKRMRAELESRDEPIAIVGMGCRFPGADGPEAFWRLLHQGVDAIRTVPPERWDVDAWYDPDPDTPGKTYTRSGGFLDGVDLFDASLFHISPREAASMDPQHRVLLETAWHALEDAGIAPGNSSAVRTGVFIGITTNDYLHLQIEQADRTAFDAYTATGNPLNFAAGRVSYVFGFQGPCMAVDAACASSLVSVHLACQSLRAHECDAALAGGVNLVLSPQGSVFLSKTRALAPDGRCKTFDASADGMSRGEGCGIVVLKRLSDAIRDGDNIQALIRGSAVGQDGPSSGLTVPNGQAQQDLIRAALKSAGVRPADIGYVEAHGTGTALGDPIEVRALSAVLSEGRDATRPFAMGSVKTNIGHLEAAAGIAGLMKTVLALRHQEIPPHLHFTVPTPHVDWSRIPAVVPTAPTAWPIGDVRRIAGVSAFGLSGIIAHLIAEEAPRQAVDPGKPERPLNVLTLSAGSEEALKELAGSYVRHLDSTTDSFANICFTANTGRARLRHRFAVVAGSSGEARAKLSGFAEAVESAGEPKLAFLFAGQGSQYAGMGRVLFETEPVFREVLERCAEILAGRLDQPLMSVLYPAQGSESPLHQTAYTQPALFAVEYALAELWRSWGVQPRMLLGHSVGEYVAACVAGVFSLEDGIRLIAERARLMQSVVRRGTMAVVFAGEGIVRRSISGLVSVAAVNGPENVVISGEESAIAELVREFEGAGIRTQLLRVSHAFHSPLMEPILSAFRRVAEGVRFSTPRIPLVSNVTGRVAEAGEMETADYWVKQLREPVRFGAGIETLREQGCEAYLEIGPGGTLIGMAQHSATGVQLASLREGRNDTEQMLTSLARLWEHGTDIKWDGFDRGHSRRRVSLPVYPFQRRRHWFEVARSAPQISEAASAAADDWLYEVAWEPKPLVRREAVADRRRWLVFSDASGLGDQLAARISATLIAPGEQPDVSDWSSCRGVVYMRGLDASLDDNGACCEPALQIVQRLAAIEASNSPKLWFVTRAARPAGVLQSTLWGLGKVVGVEHPGIWGGLIDLDPAEGASEIASLQSELEYADSEGQIRYRAGVRYVARLARRAPLPATSYAFKADASYLITGGLGAIGLRLARWMVRKGARHLILMSRGEPSPNAMTVIDEIARAGAKVMPVRADVASADQLAAALIAARSMPELKGVFHAAGVLADGALRQQTHARFEAVMAPKIRGTWNLHEATRHMRLDYFVLFSSASALFGSPGQGNYAAANAFLDAFAEFRHESGLPALSVNWGPWAEAGMAVAAGGLGTRLSAAGGMTALPPGAGFEILGRLLESNESRAAVLQVDWKKFADRCPEGGLRLFVSRLAGKAADSVASAAIGEELRAASLEDRIPLMSAYLRRQLSLILHADAADFPSDRSLVETGIDSLMVMEFLTALKRDLGLAIYPREFYERPTIDELARYLAGELENNRSASVPADAAAPALWKQAPVVRKPLVPGEQRIPGVVLLLSSPRAGSTLLRVMMAGHPALFCPPELHLLPFDTMADRAAALSASYLGEGLQRAFMELDSLSAGESKALVDSLAERATPIRELYGLLRERAVGRLIVDKSPSYAASPETLARAEELFDRPRYIHLVRHPYAVIESFVRNRFQQLIAGQNGDGYDLAEQVWAACNRNVLEVLESVDPARRHVVRYEDLVRDPAPVMRTLCDFLDIPYDAAMLQPYEGNRMTDGVHPQSLSIGDPGFLAHRSIEETLGDAWKSVRLPRALHAPTRALAARLDYPLPAEAPDSWPMRERCLDVRGLKLCICEWGPQTGTPILCIHGILDQGAAWEPVATELARKGFRAIALDLRGHGRSGHVSDADSYHLLDFLADIDAVVHSLGGQLPVLVGHSMGAALAGMFAGARPKSVGKLVLIECPSPAGDPGKAGNAPRSIATQLDYLAMRPGHTVLPDLAAAADRLRKATPSLTEELSTRLACRITEPRENGVQWTWDPRLQTRAGISFQGIDSVNRAGYLETLARIEAPVTLVYADSSGFASAEQTAAIEAVLSDSTRCVLPGGHNLHIDAAAAIADIIAR